MIGAALSDLHLGFGAFAATIDGRNARGLDVEAAFAVACDVIIADRPGLLTVAGDVFHNIRPSFHAVRAWQAGIRRILRGCPGIQIVVIPGNHDAPRTAESLTPNIVIEGEPNVHVVTTPRRLRLDVFGEAVSVACLPFVALATEETYRIDPDPDAAVNVLLVHAAVRTSADGVEALPHFYAGETTLDVGREADRWDVIACGDFHEFQRLHPTRLAFYSGAIERTSSNIWQEKAPKGVVLYDTDSGELAFHEIPTRRVMDLTLEDFDVLRVFDPLSDVNIALAALAWDGALPGVTDVENAIVRLRVDDFPRADKDAIDWVAVRALKQRCLHFALDLRYAETDDVPMGDRREHGGRPLVEQAREFMVDEPTDVRDLAVSAIEAAA